jgi:hypothetical protein
LYQLEAHPIQCPEGQALQNFQMSKCEKLGQHGYRYDYSCCLLQGMGGRKMLFTPWAAVASGTKQLTTMTQQDLQCEAGSVLDSFVLEAKDPGGSNAEIRYAYGCCEISSHMPLAIETEQRPLDGSFSAWEGLYFPARKSEGKVEMEAGFSFRTQTISHNATLITINSMGPGAWQAKNAKLVRHLRWAILCSWAVLVHLTYSQ